MSENHQPHTKGIEESHLAQKTPENGAQSLMEKMRGRVMRMLAPVMAAGAVGMAVETAEAGPIWDATKEKVGEMKDKLVAAGCQTTYNNMPDEQKQAVDEMVTSYNLIPQAQEIEKELNEFREQQPWLAGSTWDYTAMMVFLAALYMMGSRKLYDFYQKNPEGRARFHKLMMGALAVSSASTFVALKYQIDSSEFGKSEVAQHIREFKEKTPHNPMVLAHPSVAGVGMEHEATIDLSEMEDGECQKVVKEIMPFWGARNKIEDWGWPKSVPFFSSGMVSLNPLYAEKATDEPVDTSYLYWLALAASAGLVIQRRRWFMDLPKAAKEGGARGVLKHFANDNYYPGGQFVAPVAAPAGLPADFQPIYPPVITDNPAPADTAQPDTNTAGSSDDATQVPVAAVPTPAPEPRPRAQAQPVEAPRSVEQPQTKKCPHCGTRSPIGKQYCDCGTALFKRGGKRPPRRRL